MASKTLLVAVFGCVLVALLHQTAALPPGGAGSNPYVPAWVASAPWYPKWVPCDVATQAGASCQDCKTKFICNPAGGRAISCNDLAKPYCNLGECTATPSAGCA